MKKIVKKIRIVLFLFVVVTAVGVSITLFSSKGDIEKFPSIFGYKPLTILSNSMKPTFNAGDVVLINVKKDPHVNEVVTYKQTDGTLITHRIIEEVNKEGKTFFKTKGDNNNVADDRVVSRSTIIGVEQLVIPNAGYIARFVTGPIGFFLIIVIPLLIVGIYEIFKWVGLIGNKEERIQS
ncbi:signal peptidase I [Bacillus salipaludis]|uniref:Signal peptidase I n=1 Tax=Bacillus salipaludis TaxID=2547811 RepID=A0ABW8RIF4_9BACI